MVSSLKPLKLFSHFSFFSPLTLNFMPYLQVNWSLLACDLVCYWTPLLKFLAQLQYPSVHIFSFVTLKWVIFHIFWLKLSVCSYTAFLTWMSIFRIIKLNYLMGKSLILNSWRSIFRDLSCSRDLSFHISLFLHFP